MSFTHTVQPGESLWRLAGLYLGNCARWLELYNYHNAQCEQNGWFHKDLLRIEDPNLIFVGQRLRVPPRPRKPSLNPVTGRQADAGQMATPIDLKIEYTIGKDTPAIRYVQVNPDFTIKAEMSGKIAIELNSLDKYRHNLELLISKDRFQMKQKLGQIYDPAFSALVAKPEMVFESGRVTLHAPIAAKAKIGSYAVDVTASAPNHLIGVLKPPPASGSINVGSRKFKYNAEIEFKVDVVWHPVMRSRPEPLKVDSPQKVPAERSFSETTSSQATENNLGEVIAKIALVVVGTIICWPARLAAMIRPGSLYNMPFQHTIDPNRRPMA